jgi:hypothetical protein
VIVGVDDNDLLLLEDHFDINVEFGKQGDVRLEAIRQERIAAVLSEFEKDAPVAGNVANNGAAELGFMDVPPASRVALSRLAQTSFIEFTRSLHMLDLILCRQRWKILFKYVLALLHIIGLYASVL